MSKRGRSAGMPAAYRCLSYSIGGAIGFAFIGAIAYAGYNPLQRPASTTETRTENPGNKTEKIPGKPQKPGAGNSSRANSVLPHNTLTYENAPTYQKISDNTSPAGAAYNQAMPAAVESTAAALAKAGAAGDAHEVERIMAAADPYVFTVAVNNIFPGAPALYSELFGIDQPLLSTGPLDKYLLAGMFAQRFVNHYKARNDHLIGGNTGVGYSVTYGGQTHSSYRSREDARQGVLDLMRREREQANAPSSHHTFVEPTSNGEKRTTVIDTPKTPQQWETHRNLSNDPAVQRARDAYNWAGARKGDAERAAGQAARAADGAARRAGEAMGNASRAADNAAKNIGEAINNLGRSLGGGGRRR